MWIFVLLIIGVLCISLYDFFVTRIWHQVLYAESGTQNQKLRDRHKRANSIRKTYNRVMMFTVGGLVALMVAAVYTNAVVGAYNGYQAPKVPEYDTIQMALEAPPLQEIETLPENVKIEGNSSVDAQAREQQTRQDGNDSPAKKQQSENEQQQQPEPNNPLTSNETPNLELALKRSDFRTQSDYDAYVQSQVQAQQMRDRGKSGKEKRDAQQAQAQQTKRQSGKDPVKNQPPGSKSGTADVQWNKNWRKAFQNNDDNMRTPKYKCPGGISGKVIVKVKVNSNGNIISAKSLTTTVHPCLIEEAERYALMSRFETSGKEIDEGLVTYTFYP